MTMQTLDELKAVLENHGQATDGVFTDKAMLVNALSDAIKRIEALREFAQHHYQCDSHNEPPIYPCTCGLDDLLRREIG